MTVQSCVVLTAWWAQVVIIINSSQHRHSESVYGLRSLCVCCVCVCVCVCVCKHCPLLWPHPKPHPLAARLRQDQSGRVRGQQRHTTQILARELQRNKTQTWQFYTQSTSLSQADLWRFSLQSVRVSIVTANKHASHGMNLIWKLFEWFLFMFLSLVSIVTAFQVYHNYDNYNGCDN